MVPHLGIGRPPIFIVVESFFLSGGLIINENQSVIITSMAVPNIIDLELKVKF